MINISSNLAIQRFIMVGNWEYFAVNRKIYWNKQLEDNISSLVWLFKWILVNILAKKLSVKKVENVDESGWLFFITYNLI